MFDNIKQLLKHMNNKGKDAHKRADMVMGNKEINSQRRLKKHNLSCNGRKPLHSLNKKRLSCPKRSQVSEECCKALETHNLPAYGRTTPHQGGMGCVQ